VESPELINLLYDKLWQSDQSNSLFEKLSTSKNVSAETRLKFYYQTLLKSSAIKSLKNLDLLKSQNLETLKDIENTLDNTDNRTKILFNVKQSHDLLKNIKRQILNLLRSHTQNLAKHFNTKEISILLSFAFELNDNSLKDLINYFSQQIFSKIFLTYKLNQGFYLSSTDINYLEKAYPSLSPQLWKALLSHYYNNNSRLVNILNSNNIDLGFRLMETHSPQIDPMNRDFSLLKITNKIIDGKIKSLSENNENNENNISAYNYISNYVLQKKDEDNVDIDHSTKSNYIDFFLYTKKVINQNLDNNLPNENKYLLVEFLTLLLKDENFLSIKSYKNLINLIVTIKDTKAYAPVINSTENKLFSPTN
jgi:hypothetical protein